MFRKLESKDWALFHSLWPFLLKIKIAIPRYHFVCTFGSDSVHLSILTEIMLNFCLIWCIMLLPWWLCLRQRSLLVKFGILEWECSRAFRTWNCRDGFWGFSMFILSYGLEVFIDEWDKYVCPCVWLVVWLFLTHGWTFSFGKGWTWCPNELPPKTVGSPEPQ